MLFDLGLDKIDFEELGWTGYQREASNVNNFSYWYPRITNKNSGFKTPKSTIFQFTKRERDLTNEYYENMTDDGFALQVGILQTKINLEPDLDLNGKFFIKNGTFSDKFSFENCVLENPDTETIMKQFLDINYSAELHGAGGTTELILREFIDTGVEDTIYGGMRLNTEFRVFFDFDTFDIVKTVNYWDVDFMLENGAFADLADVQTLLDNKERINSEFEKNKPLVEAHVMSSVYEKTSLDGIWSMDFMLVGEEFYLIDMALAEQSAYYNGGK